MNEQRTRRRVLNTAAVVGLGALVGCSQVSAMLDSPPKLGRIRIENRDDAPHTVHLLVERDGEVVYWQSFDLEATYENDQGQTVRDIEIVPQSEWGDVRGDYHVRARLDDATSAVGKAADPVDLGVPCELLNVIVHGEPDVASLSIINAPKDEDCE